MSVRATVTAVKEGGGTALHGIFEFTQLPNRGDHLRVTGIGGQGLYTAEVLYVEHYPIDARTITAAEKHSLDCGAGANVHVMLQARIG